MGKKRLCRFARMTEAYVIGCIARNINRKQNQSYRLKHQEERRNENKFDSFSMRYRYNSDWQKPLSSLLSVSSYSFFHLFIRRGTCFIVPLVAKMCATVETPIRCHQFLCREKKILYYMQNDFFTKKMLLSDAKYLLGICHDWQSRRRELHEKYDFSLSTVALIFLLNIFERHFYVFTTF